MLGILCLVLVAVWLIGNLIKAPSNFFNVLVIGLTEGFTFALVALGYTLVYGILQLINFAHGDVFALSGLIASSILISLFNLDAQSAGVAVFFGILATLVMGMAFAAALNTTIEFVGYRPLRGAPRLAPLITAVGMSFIVQNISLAIYDVNYKSVPGLLPTSQVLSLGDVLVRWNQLIIILITIPILGALTWLVAATRQGKAMRATSQDTDAAAMMGINVNRTVSFTFALAGGLAGAGGLLYLLQFNMRYDTGFQLGLIAFTAAVLGGIGNLSGAVLGAVLIGLIKNFNEGLTWFSPGSSWTRTIIFGILIAILVFRPEGLLGERTPEGG